MILIAGKEEGELRWKRCLRLRCGYLTRTSNTGYDYGHQSLLQADHSGAADPLGLQPSVYLPKPREPWRNHVESVEEVLDLIAENSEASVGILKARHWMHMLQGYAAVHECHVGNAGDLLLVCFAEGDAAWML